MAGVKRFELLPTGLEPDMLPLHQTPINLEEGVGFEPTGLLHPLVFKTSAISQTLPTLHKVRDFLLNRYALSLGTSLLPRRA